MSSFIRRHPGVLAGIWFSVFGLLPPCLWYLPSILERHDFFNLFAVILLPAMAAFISGFIWGSRILDPARKRTHLLAFLNGIIVALLAFVIWAPLYALVLSVTDTNGETYIVGTAIMAFYAGLLGTGWVLALVGGTGGWILFVVTRRIVTSELNGAGVDKF